MAGLIKKILLWWRLLFIKLRGGGQVRCGRGSSLHPSVKLAVNSGGRLTMAERCVAAAQGLLLVEKDAVLTLGEHVSLSRGVQIVCHSQIEIGAETMLANNVLLFDHDHDYRDPGGLAARVYQTGPIIIGKNVWIGANTVILRGTTIGDNCVVGAGCVLKGEYPADSVIVQKRDTTVFPKNADSRIPREECTGDSPIVQKQDTMVLPNDEDGCVPECECPQDSEIVEGAETRMQMENGEDKKLGGEQDSDSSHDS